MKKLSSFLTKALILSFFFATLAPVASLITSDAKAATISTSLITGDTVADGTDNNILVTTMCNALKIVTGNAGKAFAAFAIISIGIGFFTGKVSWGLMIGVAAGIAAMFGAPSIVAAITGKSVFDCGN